MGRMLRQLGIGLAVLVFSLLATGCVGVRRQLIVDSQPPGALVYVNGEEVGRTPLTWDFLYYGTMDVKLRKEGYETLADTPKVWAPWWQIPPIDLVAEAFSATDRHKLSYELTPQQEGAPPEEMVRRGEELREKLESSHVPKPATQPSSTSSNDHVVTPKADVSSTPSAVSPSAESPGER